MEQTILISEIKQNRIVHSCIHSYQDLRHDIKQLIRTGPLQHAASLPPLSLVSPHFWQPIEVGSLVVRQRFVLVPESFHAHISEHSVRVACPRYSVSALFRLLRYL
jgi:hypothetical protein